MMSDDFIASARQAQEVDEESGTLDDSATH